jgi:flavodoxin I
MKALIVYDSTYGNTEKLAETIAAALGGEVKVIRVAEAGAAALSNTDLLIVASPTLGGRPTEAMSSFLNNLPASSLKGVKVASVDTRLKAKWVKIFGYAAEKIAAKLASSGGTPIAPPEGFFVRAAKGPLLDQELVRATAWAKGIM